MNKVVVLFFAADPFSSPAGEGLPRLELDEEVRQIRAKVRAAVHRDALEFDFRLAATADSLIQALNEVHPRVVHFSGHGERAGLVLEGADGMPHLVGTDALARLFRVFRGDIGVVVLNACFSLPQAQAIVDTVGCAIGTRSAISDEAAITFAASFYRAVAFGHSVHVAFDQACTALALSHPEYADCPVLLAGPGVDPASLILVQPAPGEPLPAASDHRPLEDVGSLPGRGLTFPPRRAWLVPAAIWLASTIGAIAQAENAGHVMILSLVALVIAAALLRFLKSTAGSGAARSAGAAALALALSVVAVIAGADILDANRSNQELVGIPPETGGQPTQTNYPPKGVPPAPQPAPTNVDTAADSIRVPDETGEIPDSAPPPRPVPPPLPAPDPSNVESDLATARELFDDKKYDAAVPLLERAVGAGNAEAKGFLGILYLKGWGTDKQPGRALALLSEAAAEGDARAMNALGIAHRDNEGVSRDPDVAMSWFLRAQARGYAEAMTNIGQLYRQGFGVDQQSDSLALQWYLKAARAGSLDGMVNAGMMYAQGMGTARDVKEAIRLYGVAAEAGSIRAKVELGNHYRDGDGVPENRRRARTLFLEAANAGSATGMNNLGVLYERGWGGNKDRAQAIRWFRAAAAAGSVEAVGNLEAVGAR
jgi:TPR repeat protein